jgi:hypothetical protein
MCAGLGRLESVVVDGCAVAGVPAYDGAVGETSVPISVIMTDRAVVGEELRVLIS